LRCGRGGSIEPAQNILCLGVAWIQVQSRFGIRAGLLRLTLLVMKLRAH
jgi:hypothetical protein